MITNFIEDTYKHNPLLFNIIVSAIAILSIIYFFQIRFEDNDDIVMLLIASGKYSGSPDEHLVFINVLFGFYYKTLYSLIPNTEHYTITFIVIHIFSLGSIVSFILQLKNSRITNTIILVLLFIIEFKILISLQFTTTSALLATASLCYLLDKKRIKQWLGVILFTIASLIRFEAAMLVLLISLPLFILIKNKSHAFVIVLVTITLPVIAKTFDHYYYLKDSGWEYYKSYNSFRGKINDNPNSRLITMNSNEETNDYQLLLNFMPDPSITNLNQLKKIENQIGAVPFEKKIKNIIRIGKYYIPIFFILLVSIIFLLKSKRSNRLVLIFIALIFISTLSFIAMNGTIKARVFLTSIFPILLIAAPIFSSNIKTKIHINTNVFILLLLSLFFLLQNINMVTSNNEQNKLVDEQIKLISDYKHCGKRLLFAYGADFTFEYLNPFKISNFYSQNPFLIGGWLTTIPFKNQLKSFKEFTSSKAIFINNQHITSVTTMITKSLQSNNKINVKYNSILESTNYSIIEFEITTQ